MWAWSRKSFKRFPEKLPFWKKRPLRENFQKFVPKGFIATQIHVLCANFVKFGRPEVGDIARCLPDEKISARFLTLASAPIAPKICQHQGLTVYSECRKFHPNRFTSSGVIAERVNTVQTLHKVFPILGEATASSPSNNKVNTAFGNPHYAHRYTVNIATTNIVTTVVVDVIVVVTVVHARYRR